VARIPFVAANWKMFKTRAEARAFTDAFKKAWKNDGKVKAAICPSYTALSTVAGEISGTGIHLGAQNIHFEEKGAFTGECSAGQLKEAGCDHAIVGHSERRKIFKETDADINKKVKTCLKEGIVPIFCVGETLEEREGGKMQAVIKEQLSAGLAGVSSADALKVVVAYEPVWAIGTGKTATPEQAQEVHAFIRAWLAEAYGADVAEKIIIQYGGSVKPENTAAIMKGKDVDGALIGGAALDPAAFAAIAAAAAEAKA
jgi:triosephosphate isomerase